MMLSYHLEYLPAPPGTRIRLDFGPSVPHMTGIWNYPNDGHSSAILLTEDDGFTHLINLAHVHSIMVARSMPE